MRTLPDTIRIEDIDGRAIRRDEGGYLVDPDDWNEGVAKHFAAEEGLVLGPEHFAVFAFMRAWLDEHGIMPDARFVFRDIAARRGTGFEEARRHFFELFPYGYVKQACKIAGMKQPRAWSTG